MKTRIIFSAMLFLTCSTIFAQDTTNTRFKEYYLSFSNFSPLSTRLTYKWQVINRTFFKLGLIDLSYSARTSHTSQTNGSDPFPVSTKYYSVGFQLGVEFRHGLNKQFTFFHGPGLSASYYHNENKTMDPSQTGPNTIFSESYGAGLIYAIGFLLQVRPHFLFSAELNPSVNYTMGISSSSLNTAKSKFDHTNVNVSSNFVVLSVGYRL